MSARKKIASISWHAESGALSRAINEDLCQLILMAEKQYGRISWECRIVKQIAEIFRAWRNQLEKEFFSENSGHKTGSPYFGTRFWRREGNGTASNSREGLLDE